MSPGGREMVISGGDREEHPGLMNTYEEMASHFLITVTPSKI